MATGAIKRIEVLPNYARGFTFSWVMSQSFREKLPWHFLVQQAPAPDGPWEDISPTLVNKYVWEDELVRVVGKDPVLWFRVILTTGSGGTHVSHLADPYGDLDRREWLIVRDIMRRELLQQQKMAGVPGRVWLDTKGAGTPCPECRDPVTGHCINSECGACLGSGSIPPYYGPYSVWLTFSPVRRKLDMSQDGTGSREPRVHAIRLIGSPPVRAHDVVIDTVSDRRYYAEEVKVEFEIRRVPVIQTVIGKEMPKSDPVYRLGDSDDDIADKPECDDVE